LEYCAEIQKTGNPDVIEIVNTELKKPVDDQVLVRHKAIGVNYIDIYYRNGTYPLASLPGKLGHEASGIIEDIGENVTKLKIGDRVAYVSATPGSYSTSRIVSESILIKIPNEIDFETAAAMMLKGMTVNYLFKRTANLQNFHKILFHAAAGGTGLIALQWARMLGVETIGTVGSEEKKDLAKNHGANHIINYSRENFVEHVREITDGNGVDVVFDSVGAQTFYKSIQCLKKYGLMVSFGNASGKVASFDLGLLNGNLFITRPTLFSYIATRNELETTANQLIQLVALKKIRIPIHQRFNLTDVSEAHKNLQDRRTTGCTILTV
jgi:NADPH2:quinone reductase